jgi:RimJ/RimL family protein N-acetyltransferase
MDTPRETLTETGITLVRWRADQLEDLVAAVQGSLAHLGAWLPWATDGYGPAEGTEFLTGTAARWESGEAYEYALLAPDGPLMGSCGLMRCAEDGGPEIGYWLGLPYTGRGLMTAATSLLIAEAFRQGAEHIEIRHDELNTRSGAVPARLGFTLDRKEAATEPLAPACSGTSHVWRLDRP